MDKNCGRRLRRCWNPPHVVAGRKSYLFRQRPSGQTVVGERGGGRAPGGSSQYAGRGGGPLQGRQGPRDVENHRRGGQNQRIAVDLFTRGYRSAPVPTGAL